MPNVIDTNTSNKKFVGCFQDTQIKTAYLDYHYPRLNDNILVFTCLVLPICLKQGWIVLYSETLEKDWKEKYENEWAKRSKCKNLVSI